ncbi:protein, SNF2 family [Dictyocaulus viviparus]|uniref:Protein, SNF2 family n=1 Tax=Dictyocaulus viviparus TaxID=29172 RepID=A0A0D8XHH8_DICVI|nr:protein, SNF2 family [Dictyocaulus viviparus]
MDSQTSSIFVNTPEGKELQTFLTGGEHRQINCGIHDAALAKLYEALVSQPEAKELTKTPDGLLCTLEEHQMSGLTWLMWREKCPPYGGIIAPFVHRFHSRGEISVYNLALLPQSGAKELTKTPDDLLCTLEEHQMSGLTWLMWREKCPPYGGIIADEMGLGKTLMMIALIVQSKAVYKNKNKGTLRHLTENQRGLIPSKATLVVAPTSLIHHWEHEIKSKCKRNVLNVMVYHNKSRKHLNYEILALCDVVITTYKLVSYDYGTKKMESPFVKIRWSRIILDEAHNIKNRKCMTAKAACRLASHARWCVTGTPIHNNLWDLFSLLKVEYFDDEDIWKSYIVNATNKSHDRLNLLLKNFVLRREKNAIPEMAKKFLADLPAKYHHNHMLELSNEERRAYTLIYDACRAKVKATITGVKLKRRYMDTDERKRYLAGEQRRYGIKNEKMPYVLVILLRLRQACNHFYLAKSSIDMEGEELVNVEGIMSSVDLANIENIVEPENVDDVLKVYEKSFVKSFNLVKTEAVMEALTNEALPITVVVSQWTSFLKIFEEHVMKRFSNAKCSTIASDVSAQDRQQRVEDFNKSRKGINIMLVSIKAGGVGLNLTGGNHLILTDLYWNPAIELQAEDRVHRIGQTKDVHVHR